MTRAAWLAALFIPLVASEALQAQEQGAIRRRTAYEDLQMFSQVLNHIRVNHPDSVDQHRLISAAIEGMLAAADPHSYVITSYRLDPEKDKAYRAGRLHPVPITFAFIGVSPVVVGVVPGSSAARADILPGDELVAVDRTPVTAESGLELEVELAGNRNSQVVLTLERRRSDGSLVQLERTVKREKYSDISAVPAAFMLDSVTGYVRITGFDNTSVASDLKNSLRQLERRGMRRLLLDLRDNPGGMIKEAGAVAGEFLPRGAVLYTTEGRKSDVTDTVRVGGFILRREKTYPMIVLVNAATASSAELVAGALQDHDRALIVGRPSFGKSLLMQGFPLYDGSVAMMVIGHVKTPCGRVIQRQYRGIARRDYYRMARAERDTVGRPSCQTSGGRTVYGGGGIVPDIMFGESRLAPLWVARMNEAGILLQWIGGHVDAEGARYTSLDSLAANPRATPGAVQDFRRFAHAQGIEIPEGDEADARLNRMIVLAVARTKWNDPGYYRIAAVLDAQVEEAVRHFPGADDLMTLWARQ